MLKNAARRLGTPGTLLGVAALAIAAAGGATAQSLLDGGDIRNNSLTGADIRNRSLTPADFRGSVRGRTGPRGPQGGVGPVGPAGRVGPIGPPGVQGAAGANGDPGQRGPSDGRASRTNGTLPIGDTAQPVVVESLGLAPGKWLVTATVSLTNPVPDPATATCTLDGPGGELARAVPLDDTIQRVGSATLLGQADLPGGGTVQLRCTADDDGVATTAGADRAIHAVRVETLVAD